MGKLQIKSASEADQIKELIIHSCNITTDIIKSLVASYHGIDFFKLIKFSACVGKDPLIERNLNFIEQINQTFTYLASMDAVKYLLKNHPECAPYSLNLGTQSGYDIISFENRIIAEVFSATSPNSNNKLNKDYKKLRLNTTAKHKYIFFYCQENIKDLSYYQQRYVGVDIIPLQL